MIIYYVLLLFICRSFVILHNRTVDEILFFVMGFPRKTTGLDLPCFAICHIRDLPYFVNSQPMGDPEYGRSGTMEDAERPGALDCEHSFDLMSDSLE